MPQKTAKKAARPSHAAAKPALAHSAQKKPAARRAKQRPAALESASRSAPARAQRRARAETWAMARRLRGVSPAELTDAMAAVEAIEA